MNQFLTIWAATEPRKRLAAGLAGLALLVAVFGLARIAAQPSMALLYSGLESTAAGEVLSALEQRGVAFDVRGDSIFVTEGMRDRIRMDLAAQDMPSGGAAGYELLDGISGFGTTSEMFDATYWRAKEGELARTILSLPNVRRARVHIASPRRRPFERRTDPTASITVTMRTGGLGESQAQAIRHLVSSAVAGLQPDAVTVVDSVDGVVLRAGDERPETRAGAIADERAAALRVNVERLLTARVGEGAVVVEVSVETDLDSEKITERVIDPAGRVAISTDTEETSENETGGSANVTVASNLPDGDANGGSGSERTNSQTRERINYEVSEVLRERVRRPGEIRRISVAALVDGIRATGPDGQETWIPRPDEELESLRDLIRSAIGFDPARGDVVTIQTMEFSAEPERGTVAETDAFDFLSVNAMSLVQLGVLSAVALALGLLVLRPMILAKPAPMLAAAGALEGPDALGEMQPGLEGAVEGSLEAADRIIDASTVQNDQLTELRDAVSQRPEDAAHLLSNWLDTSATRKEQA